MALTPNNLRDHLDTYAATILGVAYTATASIRAAIKAGLWQLHADALCDWLVDEGIAFVLGTANPEPIGTAAAGNSANASHENHVHAHGNMATSASYYHAAAVSGGNPGFMTGAQVASLASAAQGATTITAGAGLTGGGDLSANRTLTVAANADGSIVVNADDIQVGVITDTQHGARGHDTLHTVSDATHAGFQSSAHYIDAAASRSGTWANRPSTNLRAGQYYFDSGLHKPYWYDLHSATWYDAAGVAHA
jgi:hypothetical protein